MIMQTINRCGKGTIWYRIFRLKKWWDYILLLLISKFDFYCLMLIKMLRVRISKIIWQVENTFQYSGAISGPGKKLCAHHLVFKTAVPVTKFAGRLFKKGKRNKIIKCIYFSICLLRHSVNGISLPDDNCITWKEYVFGTLIVNIKRSYVIVL